MRQLGQVLFAGVKKTIGIPAAGKRGGFAGGGIYAGCWPGTYGLKGHRKGGR